MTTLILFVIGLVLFVIVASFLWWIIFNLGASLWPQNWPKAIVFGKVLYCLIVLLFFVYWLSSGMSLPFLHLRP